MKPYPVKRSAAAFSFLELLLVLVIVLLAAGTFVLPYLVRSGRAPRIDCINNLKQIGLAYRMWSNDHDGKFPMSVSTNHGGSMEYNYSGKVFRHYEAMANELNSPKRLWCPSDTRRRRAEAWGVALSDQNLSYFVGINADESNPLMILSGDRNITGGILTNGNVMILNANIPVGWTKEIHVKAGNIGLADGSALQANEQTLRNQLARITYGPMHIAIP